VCHSAQEARLACVPRPVPADLWAIFLPPLQQLLSVVSLEPPDKPFSAPSCNTSTSVVVSTCADVFRRHPHPNAEDYVPGSLLCRPVDCASTSNPLSIGSLGQVLYHVLSVMYLTEHTASTLHLPASCVRQLVLRDNLLICPPSAGGVVCPSAQTWWAILRPLNRASSLSSTFATNCGPDTVCRKPLNVCQEG
jgi:hypothetical protein